MRSRNPVTLSKWAILVLALVVMAPSPSSAQATTASMLGIARDMTGAVLPGATITILNVETGISRTVTTDEQGRYRAAQLALGEYEVHGALPGFQTTIRRGIQLTLGREAVVDLTLNLGDVTEDVVVLGEAPLVESTNATVSGHVDERQMRELPLNARSYVDLSLLQAGTVQARTAGSGFDDKGTQLTVSGSRPTSTTFLLDGTMTTSTRGKAPVSVAGSALGVDAIREFEVVTSPFSAEYGRGTGGTISVVSKAGTNRFTGSLFYFLRNDDLDARSFFDPPEGPPEFKRNQFGFSAGGPIVHNRTFFFGNFEGLRQRLGQTNIYRVPNDGARQGVVGTQTVPINPAVRPYLLLYPVANGRDFGNGVAEYSTGYSQPTDENFYTFRLDQQISGNHSIFGRYTLSDAKDQTSGALGMFVENATSLNQYVTIEYKAILSSRLLNVARVGYTRQNVADRETQLVDAPGLALAPGMPLPRLSVTGLSAFGSVDQLPRIYVDNTFEFYDSLTYVRSNHTIKAGGQIQPILQHAVGNQRQATRWQFSSINDFMVGRASRVEHSPRELADPIRNLRQTFSSAYIQDDIRLNPRLTLNVGLRAEYASTMSEVDGKLSKIPVARFPVATLDDYVTGDPWYDNPGITWGPRAGLAWDPFGTDRTAIRGGFGIFYDHYWGHWMNSTGNFRMSPFYTTIDLRETLPFPMTSAQIVELTRVRQGRPTPVGNQVFQPDDHLTKQQVRQYGIDVQHQLGDEMVVKVGYKGSRGSDLPRIINTNTALPERVVDGIPVFSATPTARNPTFGEMTIAATDSESFYNALLVEFSKRYSHGYQFQVSYTLAKMIDEGSGVRTSGDAIGGAGGGYVLSYEFRELDRSLSTFDVRNNLVLNAAVELPFGNGRRFDLRGFPDALFGGWQVNGIVVFASGNPATFAQGTTATTQNLGGSRRPDLGPGGNQNPVLGGPDQYFDPTQLVPADPQRFGTVGRNTLIGPGYATLDMSLAKNFQVRDAFRIQFRSELFNLLNRANFSLPNMQVFDGRGVPNGSAGRITTTAGSARQIQFGLRMLW